MPSLQELEAEFIKIKSLVPQVIYDRITDINQADGIIFLCPKCYITNKGIIGTHSVICWFVGKVPDDLGPKPGRWTPQGTGLHDLTFIPSAGRSHSVLLTSGCGWHGFVKDGKAD